MCIHILSHGIIRLIIPEMCYEWLSFKQSWWKWEDLSDNEMSKLDDILNI